MCGIDTKKHPRISNSNYCPVDVLSTVASATRLHDKHGLLRLYCRLICSAKSSYTISYVKNRVKFSCFHYSLDFFQITCHAIEKYMFEMDRKESFIRGWIKFYGCFYKRLTIFFTEIVVFVWKNI